MAFILAPYFNTYTQQICIDDAVVTDPARAENVLTNDGSTMRIMVQSMGRPSAWSRQKEVVEDDSYKKIEGSGDGADGEAAIEPTAPAKGPVIPKTVAPEPAKATAEEADGTPAGADPGDEEVEASVDDTATRRKANGNAGTDKKEAGSETDSEDAILVAKDGAAAIQESAGKLHPDATTKTTKPSKGASSSVKAEATTSDANQDDPANLLLKTEAGTEGNTDSGRKTSAKPGDVGVHISPQSETATPKISSSVGHQLKVNKPARKGFASAVKPAKDVDYDLCASQSRQDVDWDSYRSQDTLSAKEKEEKETLLEEERERLRQEREERKETERERREEEKEARAEARKQRAEDAAFKREQEKARREQQKANVEWATSTKSFTDEEKAAMKAKMETTFDNRFTGMMENKKEYEFDTTSVRGPSQIVTYTSRFVDKLSDITDDMNISGSLSIKAGKFGGSGRGAFIDSDKFKESDLNFYISVKVINQTINFKDALVYNPVRSVDKENFNAVFGDGFISGFQEGGEFNALVSMKILNKAKKTDIQAEAKVAFTAGPVDITAEANVNIAKVNIETNTETTIQVSWSGGGHVKPREQQWDVQSLMQAAARFPDLVAQCPQRIYAIVTKYESLRSFIKTKPAGYTKLQYENAQIYTNAMMDSYMSYKSLYTKLGSYIFDVQNESKVIKAWQESSTTESTTADGDTKVSIINTVGPPPTGSVVKLGPPVHDTFRFPATVAGLGQAKKAIRRQMALVVNEVDTIEKDPKLATDDDHYEPFQDTVAFEERVPKVETPEPPKTDNPLSGQRILAKTQTVDEAAQAEEAANSANSAPLMEDTGALSMDERSALETYVAQRPSLGKNLKLTAPLGSEKQGVLFNNLEFLQPQWRVTKLEAEIHGGAISAFWIYYDNGLILSRGVAKGGRKIELTNFRIGERIISGSIQVGKGKEEKAEHKVIAVQLHTNRGRSFIGQAAACSFDEKTGHTRDGEVYTDVKTNFFDAQLSRSNLKGLYGRADEKAVWRLGFIWGDLGNVSGIAHHRLKLPTLTQKGKQDEAVDKFTDNSSPSDVLDPITQAMAESGQRQAKIDSLEKQVKESSTNKELLNSELNSSRHESEQRQIEVSRLTSELTEANSKLLSWGGRQESWRRGRVEIFFIAYGGRLVWDDNVAQRFLGYAERGERFRFEDEQFGGDPWYGVLKSGSIIYRYDRKGEIRHLVGQQGEEHSFDAL